MKDCINCYNSNLPSCPFYNQCNRNEQRKKLMTRFDIDCHVTERDKLMCELYGCEGENYEE